MKTVWEEKNQRKKEKEKEMAKWTIWERVVGKWIRDLTFRPKAQLGGVDVIASYMDRMQNLGSFSIS